MALGDFIKKYSKYIVYWYLIFPLVFAGINLYAWVQLNKIEQRTDKIKQEVREIITDKNIKKIDELLIEAREERKNWADLKNYLDSHPEIIFNYRINKIIEKYNLNKVEEKRFNHLLQSLEKNFDNSTIESLFTSKEFELDTTLTRRIKEGREWYKKWYKEHKGENPYKNVLTKKSIKECLSFLEKNDSFFTDIIKKFNLTNPKTKELLVSLIRIETHLGKYPGKDKAFNILASHYIFNKNKQTRKFALKQILYLIKLKNKINLDPFSYSSIMGAIGWTQGIPKALNDYAVDFDKDGKINLFSLSDAVGFTLNYLGVREGSSGTKNISNTLKWYNPYDKWYLSTIKQLADSLYNYRNRNKRNEKNLEIVSQKVP